MSTLIEKIKSRGYWRIQVHPSVFQTNRAPKLSELERVFRDSHVELRGWDYPHDPREGYERGDDYIQGTVSWDHFHELWRLYQSGQFIHYFGMREDWYPEGDTSGLSISPGSFLNLSSTLFTMTEVFLFAARLTEKFPLGPEVVVLYRLVGLAGRQLQTFDSRKVPLAPYRRASDELQEFGRELTLQPGELIARTSDFAVDQTLLIYERFNWDPSRESVMEEQRRFLERRY